MADYCVGLDVRKRQWTVHVLDAKGNKVQAYSFKGTWSRVPSAMAALRAAMVVAVCSAVPLRGGP